MMTTAISLLAAHLAPTASSQGAPSQSLTVTPVGLYAEGAPGSVLASIVVDGEPRGMATRSIRGGERTPLADFPVEARIPTGEGRREIVYTLSWGETEALRLEGTLESRDGKLSLRTTRATYAEGTPLRLAPGTALAIEEGYHEDTITLYFAWSSSPRGTLDVDLDHDAGGAIVKRLQTLQPVAGASNVWSAKYHLSHLPLTLDVKWNATVKLDGRQLVSTGSQIFFLSRSATDGRFDNAEGTGVVTAAGLHDVTKKTLRLSLPDEIFRPREGAENRCHDVGIYDTAFGELYRIGPYLRAPVKCEGAGGPDPTPTATPTSPSPAPTPTPIVTSPPIPTTPAPTPSEELEKTGGIVTAEQQETRAGGAALALGAAAIAFLLVARRRT